MAIHPTIRDLAASPETTTALPALFIGHGNPMNALEDSEFSRAWAAVARSIPKPRAVICVSAHWETAGTKVTAMEQPRTIHDFYLPLLYVLGAQGETDGATFFADRVTLGSMSMRSVRIG